MGAQAYQNYVEDWSLEVDGKKVSLNKNEKKIMKINSPLSLETECTVYWHSDNVVEVNTPKGCVSTSNSLAARSYRVKSDQCKPLSKTVSDKIKSEEEKCVKYITKNTEVSTIWKISKTDVYSERKHSFIYKEDKICISQDPVLYCSNASVAKDIRKKSIKYVCLPEGCVAKLYEARIQRGESPQELKHQPVAFTAEMEQPVSCVRRL